MGFFETLQTAPATAAVVFELPSEESLKEGVSQKQKLGARLSEDLGLRATHQGVEERSAGGSIVSTTGV